MADFGEHVFDPLGGLDNPIPRRGQAQVEPVPATEELFDLLQLGAEALHRVMEQDEVITGARLDATIDSNAIIQNTARAQDLLADDALQAYDNLQRIERLPSGLTNIMGIFDRDWNREVQAIELEEVQLKSSQLSSRAEAQIGAIKSGVTLAEIEGEQAASRLESARGLIELEQSGLALTYQGQQIRVMMTQEQRATIDFKLASMSEGQVRALLRNPTPEWEPYVGLLEERLQQETKLDLEIAQASQNFKKGEIELAEANLRSAARKIPDYMLLPMIANAQQEGQVFVSIGEGANAVQMPVANLIEAYAEIKEATTTVRSDVLANTNEQLNNQISATIGTSNALSTVDPRAGRERDLLIARRDQLDPNNPQDLQLYALQLERSEARLKEITEDAAKTFTSTEAQNAVRQWGNSGGQFSPQGGIAVVADTASRPPLTSRDLYAGAYSVLNSKVAERIAQQNSNIGLPTLDAGSEASVQSFMAAALRPNTRIDVDKIAQEELANPETTTALQDEIAAVRYRDAINGVLQTLSEANGADPIWAQLNESNGAMFFDENEGRPTLDRLVEVIERRTTANGRRADYTQAFIDGVRNYAINSSDASVMDPNYSIYSAAMETAVYGSNSGQAIMSDLMVLIDNSRVLARQQMQQRIDADVSGQTQREFDQRENRLLDLIDQDAFGPGVLRNRERPAAAPSATGIPNTSASDIRALYGQ